MTRPGRLFEVLCLLILTAAGFGLRAAEIDLFGLSPDDGNYLHSAGVTHMLVDADLDWTEQDENWFERTKTYRHSYVHQYAIRWFKRAGADNVSAVRLGSVILGSLTPLILFLLLAGKDDKRRRLALLSAVMLAGYSMHVWLSRTGWGQPGCTFFFVVYLLFADRLFHQAKGRGLGRTSFYAAGMMLAALGAYGYHEMIVVHVAGMGLYSVLHLLWNRGKPGERDRARAFIAFGLSCIPVTLWASTLLSDSFAQEHWSGLVQEAYGKNYFDYRLLVLKTMFKSYGLHEQVGWIVIALSVPGMVFMRRRDQALFRFLFTTFMMSWAVFFFAFRDPYLVRIYLPTFILLIVFAAEGMLGFADRFALERRGLARVVIASIVVFLWAQSAVTLFVRSDTPLTVASFYTPLKQPHRRPLKPISDYLHTHRQSGEVLGINGDFSPFFSLQDEGHSGQHHNGAAWEKPLAEQPTWIVGGQRQMKSEGHALEAGGNFEFIVADTTGRLALYRVRRP